MLTIHFLASDLASAATEATEPGFDLSSIKELMDSFDPAALLPEMETIFGKLSTVCQVAVMMGPLIMLILGVSYLMFAPKEANYYFGYRCYFGMGSIPAWRFTQRLAGVVLGSVGLVLTVIMLMISGGFAKMEVTDMAWRAVNCLVWEVILALLANLSINLAAALRYDSRGNLRRKRT